MKRVTIIDVARAAGVSRQTVSRAINNSEHIRPETRERVMAAVAALGYRPNRQARSMVTQRTNTVGLVVGDITNPFFAEVARGVEDTARAHDYHVFLTNTDNRAENELLALNALAGQGVDGIIAFANSAGDDVHRAFADSYGPLLLVNRRFDHHNVTYLLADIEGGARLAVDHLVAGGHAVIGMISNVGLAPERTRRVQGFWACLAAHGRPRDPSLLALAAPTIAGGQTAARELLAHRPDVTGLFAYNDLMAIGAMRAGQELGRRIGDDLAVVGFDDIALASLVTPTLTTIRTDKYRLGQLAMQRILAMIAAPDRVFSPLEMDVELVTRSSTRASATTPARR